MGFISVSQQDHSSQIPPSQAIEKDDAFHATSQDWFEYPIRVYPHHTDHGGMVWHGTYLQWLEEARVEYLRTQGLDYSELAALGCILPVVNLSIQYHHPLYMGEEALLQTRMNQVSGVRIHFDYQMQSFDRETQYLTAEVTLVPMDAEQGKIMRRLPPSVKEVLSRQKEN